MACGSPSPTLNSSPSKIFTTKGTSSNFFSSFYNHLIKSHSFEYSGLFLLAWLHKETFLSQTHEKYILSLSLTQYYGVVNIKLTTVFYFLFIFAFLSPIVVV